MRTSPLSFALAAAVAATTLTGCGGRSATTTLPTGDGTTSSSTQRLPATMLTFDSQSTIGVNLTGQQPTHTQFYGNVLGYFRGNVIKASSTVTVAAGSTVVFSNLDGSFPHTAAFLGNATRRHAPWPATFDGGTVKSPAGTDISAHGFTTGTMSPHTMSAIYAANVPGFYMIGCYFHYNTHKMRTVIIVKS